VCVCVCVCLSVSVCECRLLLSSLLNLTDDLELFRGCNGMSWVSTVQHVRIDEFVCVRHHMHALTPACVQRHAELHGAQFTSSGSRNQSVSRALHRDQLEQILCHVLIFILAQERKGHTH